MENGIGIGIKRRGRRRIEIRLKRGIEKKNEK